MTPILLFAVAQMDLGAGAVSFGQSALSANMMNNVLENNRAPNGGAARRPVARAKTTYRESPAVTNDVKRRYVAFLGRAAGPKVAQAMAGWLQKNDFRDAWAKAEASQGLRRRDAIDAVAATWLLTWSIANQAPLAPKGQAQAVRRQFAALIPTLPSFARLDDAERQRFAEELMADYLIKAGGYAGMRSDPAKAQALADSARQAFLKTARVDLREVRLTDRGFVKA